MGSLIGGNVVVAQYVRRVVPGRVTLGAEYQAQVWSPEASQVKKVVHGARGGGGRWGGGVDRIGGVAFISPGFWFAARRSLCFPFSRFGECRSRGVWCERRLLEVGLYVLEWMLIGSRISAEEGFGIVGCGSVFGDEGYGDQRPVMHGVAVTRVRAEGCVCEHRVLCLVFQAMLIRGVL